MIVIIVGFIFLSDFTSFSRVIEIGFFTIPVIFLVIKKIIAEINKRKKKDTIGSAIPSNEDFRVADDSLRMEESRDQSFGNNPSSSVRISQDQTTHVSSERSTIVFGTEAAENPSRKTSVAVVKSSISDASIRSASQEKSSICLFCPSCGDPIEKFEQVCTVCGSARPVCVICYGSLFSSEPIVRLPCCLQYGHKEHLEEHLSNEGSCPVCQEQITIEELIPIKTH